MQLSLSAGENLGIARSRGIGTRSLSPANDNLALDSLRRVLMSEIEALLNASQLTQVKSEEVFSRTNWGARNQLRELCSYLGGQRFSSTTGAEVGFGTSDPRGLPLARVVKRRSRWESRGESRRLWKANPRAA